MHSKIIAIVFIFINNFRFCQSILYQNYSLFNVEPTNQEHLKFLQGIDERKYIDVVFWKKPYRVYENVQLIVNPIDRELFLERANHYKLRTKLLMNDVQSAFEEQAIRRYFRLNVDYFSWHTYHSLEDIYQWLSDLAVKYPNVLQLTSIGKSGEGREIFAVQIRKGRPKFKVIVEGGIHGNEWISVEFVTYLVNQLVRSESNSQLSALVLKYEWHLIPVLNPDGYKYSQRSDRLWRKNRRILGGNHVGVDLNRNFDYSFGKRGTSKDETDAYYCGPYPFSESESKALADFVADRKRGTKFYFSFHGYGQKIIIPYADRIKHIDNYGEAENFARQAIYKMYKLHKVKYGIGTVYDTLGLRISGNSASYIKKTHNIRYVYTFYLRDNGTFGYALPPSQILPSCKEALSGVIELMTAKHTKMRMHLFNREPRLRLTKLFVIFFINFLLL